MNRPEKREGESVCVRWNGIEENESHVRLPTRSVEKYMFGFRVSGFEASKAHLPGIDWKRHILAG